MKWFPRAVAAFLLLFAIRVAFNVQIGFLMPIMFAVVVGGWIGLFVDVASADKNDVLKRGGWIGVIRWQFGFGSRRDYGSSSASAVRTAWGLAAVGCILNMLAFALYLA